MGNKLYEETYVQDIAAAIRARQQSSLAPSSETILNNEYITLEQFDYASPNGNNQYAYELPIVISSDLSDYKLYMDFSVSSYIDNTAILGTEHIPGWSEFCIYLYNNNLGCSIGTIESPFTLGRHSILFVPGDGIYYDSVKVLNMSNGYALTESLDLLWLFKRTGASTGNYINYFNGRLFELSIQNKTTNKYVMKLKPAKIYTGKENNKVLYGQGLVDMVNGLFYSMPVGNLES